MLRRRRIAVLVLVATLMLPTACADQEASYCDALAKKQTIFADEGGGQGLLPELSDLEKLAEKAPDDLTDEWQIFVNAVRALRQAITDAGVQPRSIVDGKRPSGVSDVGWAAVTAAADGLTAPAVRDAVSGIDQQAKDVCKLQLGLS